MPTNPTNQPINIQKVVPFGSSLSTIWDRCSYNCKFRLVFFQGNFIGQRYQEQVFEKVSYLILIVTHWYNFSRQCPILWGKGSSVISAV